MKTTDDYSKQYFNSDKFVIFCTIYGRLKSLDTSTESENFQFNPKPTVLSTEVNCSIVTTTKSESVSHNYV